MQVEEMMNYISQTLISSLFQACCDRTELAVSSQACQEIEPAYLGWLVGVGDTRISSSTGRDLCGQLQLGSLGLLLGLLGLFCVCICRDLDLCFLLCTAALCLSYGSHDNIFTR